MAIIVAIKEAIGFAHPDGLLVIGRPGAGAIVKCCQLTVAAVRKMTVSVSGTASLTDTIGLNGISGLTVGRSIHSQGKYSLCRQ